MTSFEPQPSADPTTESRLPDSKISAMQAIIHHDPAARGLASYRGADGRPLDDGQLLAAATHLAKHARSVGIVTGFCAVTPQLVTAETDGPPGALYLARACDALGIEVTLVTDRYCVPLLESGLRAWRLDRVALWEFPFADSPPVQAIDPVTRWTDRFFSTGPGARWSHLIAIERPGPSHTPQSLALQSGQRADLHAGFLAMVSPPDQNVCHSMRGRPIDAWSAPLHRLCEIIAERRLPITTIGVGDGGNEIGMGHFAWETLVAAIGSEPAGRIACRIATDYAMIAGVSNWGGYALALAVVGLRGQLALARDWTAASQQRLVEQIVRETNAVDGITNRHEPTVDGLEMQTYLEPLRQMRVTLGLPD